MTRMFARLGIVAAVVLLAGVHRLPLIRPDWYDSPRHRPSCLTNPLTLSQGLAMYRDDFDDRMPLPGTWSTVIIGAYVKDQSVLDCPGDWKAFYGPRSNGYAINRALEGKSFGGSKGKQNQSTESENVSQDTVVLFESDQHRPNASGGAESVCQPPRHANGNIFLFADWNARAVATIPPFGPPSSSLNAQNDQPGNR